MALERRPRVGVVVDGAVGGNVTRFAGGRPTFRDCGHVEEQVRRRCHGGSKPAAQKQMFIKNDVQASSPICHGRA